MVLGKVSSKKASSKVNRKVSSKNWYPVKKSLDLSQKELYDIYHFFDDVPLYNYILFPEYSFEYSSDNYSGYSGSDCYESIYDEYNSHIKYWYQKNIKRIQHITSKMKVLKEIIHIVLYYKVHFNLETKKNKIGFYHLLLNKWNPMFYSEYNTPKKIKKFLQEIFNVYIEYGGSITLFKYLGLPKYKEVDPLPW